MNKATKILVVVLIVGMLLGLTACSQTQEEYFAELKEAKQKNNDPLNGFINGLFNSNFSVSFSINNSVYPGVTRDGWQKKDADGKDYKFVDTKTDVDIIYNNGKVYEKSTQADSIVERWFLLEGADYTLQRQKVNGEEIPATESYDESILRTILSTYLNIKDNDSVITVKNVSRIGKKLIRIETRTFDVIDGATDFTTGFGEDISYDWEKLNGLTNSNITFTIKKDKITEIEYFSDKIIVYYAAKSVIDSTKVLYADVYQSASMRVSINYNEAVIP